MPRYKKKNLLRQFDEGDVQKALVAVEAGLSIRKAAAMYAIPRTTLQDYISGRSKPSSSLGRPPALSRDLERQIVNTVQDAAEMGFGVNSKGIREKTGAI